MQERRTLEGGTPHIVNWSHTMSRPDDTADATPTPADNPWKKGPPPGGEHEVRKAGGVLGTVKWGPSEWWFSWPGEDAYCRVMWETGTMWRRSIPDDRPWRDGPPTAAKFDVRGDGAMGSGKLSGDMLTLDWRDGSGGKQAIGMVHVDGWEAFWQWRLPAPGAWRTCEPEPDEPTRFEVRLDDGALGTAYRESELWWVDSGDGQHFRSVGFDWPGLKWRPQRAGNGNRLAGLRRVLAGLGGVNPADYSDDQSGDEALRVRLLAQLEERERTLVDVDQREIARLTLAVYEWRVWARQCFPPGVPETDEALRAAITLPTAIPPPADLPDTIAPWTQAQLDRSNAALVTPAFDLTAPAPLDVPGKLTAALAEVGTTYALAQSRLARAEVAGAVASVEVTIAKREVAAALGPWLEALEEAGDDEPEAVVS